MTRTHTDEGIPILQIGTLNTHGRDMMTHGSTQLEEWVSEIDKENPIVAQYILQVGRTFPPDLRRRVIDNMAGLYKLLRTQGEIYQLEETS